jgi:hypothetical protein
MKYDAGTRTEYSTSLRINGNHHAKGIKLVSKGAGNIESNGTGETRMLFRVCSPRNTDG